MTVDVKSTPLEPFALQARVVQWECPLPDSNRHSPHGETDFKSVASTDFAKRAKELRAFRIGSSPCARTRRSASRRFAVRSTFAQGRFHPAHQA